MTKYDFAVKLYTELEKTQDFQKTVNSLKSVTKDNKPLSVQEQLEIVNLLRQIHTEKTKGLFEDVSAFLALVNQIEAQIKAQSNSEGANNANK